MKKKIFFNDIKPMWHQRGQFEYEFQKMVRSYIFFNKWPISTQNSIFYEITRKLELHF